MKRWKIVALIVAFLLLPGASRAEEYWSTKSPKVLVGLKGVDVLIAKMNPQAQGLGLTRDQIQTDVELRLRKAGIKVLTEKERLESGGKSFM